MSAVFARRAMPTPFALAHAMGEPEPKAEGLRRADAEWRAMQDAHDELQAMPADAALGDLVDAFDRWHLAARRFLMAARGAC